MILTNIQSCKDWFFSDTPSDVTVEAGGTSFAIHKFPMASKCGRMRRLFAEADDHTDVPLIHLHEMPGGANAFELVAKFCYGINPQITPSNVAMLRCAAHYLEMTQDDGDELNLESLTEAYLKDAIITDSANSITVLMNTCENLLPLAEELDIVNRCIDTIVSETCKELTNTSRSVYSRSVHNHTNDGFRADGQMGLAEWSTEQLLNLHIYFFQKILYEMKSKGLPHEITSGAIMQYAQNSLNRHTKRELEERNVVEAVVNLLPPGKNAAPTSFLSGLLRSAIMLDATPDCRMDLERRLALQLDDATSHDLLVLSFSYNDDTLFDVDVVHRIVANFLELDGEQYCECKDIQGLCLSKKSAMTKVSKLMDSYLAEIAPDRNLSVSKFIGLAEVLQDNGRVVDDGLYRAIDICLKAHPTATDVERKKLCKLIDCQRLSQEACTHAAKNERLPIHVVVRVLYFEQLRLRNDMQSGSFYRDGDNFRSNCSPQLMNNIGFRSSMDNYESIRLENREMRLEFVRLRIRLTDVEKECLCMKQMMVKSSSTNRFMNSFSRNLTKFQSLFREGVHILQFSKSTHHHRPQQTASSHSGQLASLSGRRL
eukprot:Gb_00937 [translate_table: standard]